MSITLKKKKITTGRKKLSDIETVPYSVFVEKKKRTFEEQLKELIPLENQRKNGRGLLDFRKPYMKCGVLKDVRGSAYVEMGNTKVIASVTGPVEMSQTMDSNEQGFLKLEVTFSEFSGKSREDTEEIETEVESLSETLNRSLEPAVINEEYGNVQVCIVLVIVESDGGTVPCCTIAASLALANARLPMSELVASASLAVCSQPPLVIVDPDSEEETFFLKETTPDFPGSFGVATLSYMVNSSLIVDYTFSSNIEPQFMIDAISQLTDICSEISQIMRKALVKDVEIIIPIIKLKNTEEEDLKSDAGVSNDMKKLSTK